jgi:transcriptional regulator with XRE-family HTH domain
MTEPISSPILSPMTRGERIRQARLAAGKTLEAIGNEMGVSLQAVKAWEAGGGIKPPNLARLAQVLGVELDWLNYGDQQPGTGDSIGHPIPHALGGVQPGQEPPPEVVKLTTTILDVLSQGPEGAKAALILLSRLEGMIRARIHVDDAQP